MSWTLLRDMLGDGQWWKLGEYLGYRALIPKSNKRIRKAIERYRHTPLKSEKTS